MRFSQNDIFAPGAGDFSKTTNRIDIKFEHNIQYYHGYRPNLQLVDNLILTYNFTWLIMKKNVLFLHVCKICRYFVNFR